jgi:hypothetical protein
VLVPKERFDQHVLPQLLHQMSRVADPIFKELLTDCVKELSADDSLEAGLTHVHISAQPKPFWSTSHLHVSP